jgi:protein-L-isoaspartate O-methyltransferase
LSARVLIAALAAAAAFCVRAQESEVAPFITTPSDVVERMLRFAGTGPADLVVDLGSGDGRIVIAAARVFGARGLGIELDPALVEKSRQNARAAGVASRVAFVHGDVLKADISQASVVTVYLLPSLINRLQPRFLATLSPGTRVVSHAFAMVGWKPDREETMRIAQRHEGQGGESRLFLWVVPAAARGVWQGEGLRLEVQQNYQEIEVAGSVAGKALESARATLSGSDIVWEAKGLRFKGRVEGRRMAGEITRDGVSSPLVLTKKP